MKTENLMIAAVILVTCLHISDVRAAEPRISFQNETHDLGRVASGRKVKVHFPFSNIGDGTLVVHEIQVDCDCTEAHSVNSELPPQSRSEVVALLDTSSLRPGRNERRVRVRSNDPLRRAVILTMVVEVIHE